jgi:hypothetical protein
LSLAPILVFGKKAVSTQQSAFRRTGVGCLDGDTDLSLGSEEKSENRVIWPSGDQKTNGLLLIVAINWRKEHPEIARKSLRIEASASPRLRDRVSLVPKNRL